MESSSSRHVRLVSSSWVVKPLETNRRAKKFCRFSAVSSVCPRRIRENRKQTGFRHIAVVLAGEKGEEWIFISASTVDNIEVLFIRIYLSFALTRRETFFSSSARSLQSTIDGKNFRFSQTQHFCVCKFTSQQKTHIVIADKRVLSDKGR